MNATTSARSSRLVAERTEVYTSVRSATTARDPRVRAAALAAHERAELERAHRENRGRISSFWLRQAPAAPAAPPSA